MSAAQAVVDADRPILTRVGATLLVASVLWFVYEQWTASSTPGFRLNLLPIVLGLCSIGLLRGHLRIASGIRWFSALMLVLIPLGLLTLLALQPWALTRAIWQNDASNNALPTFVALSGLGIFAWAFQALGAEPVQAARRAIGRPARRMWIPMVFAVALCVTMVVVSHAMFSSEAGRKAERLVQAELGADFSVEVTQLHRGSGPLGTRYSAVVVAWRGDTVRLVPVSWQED
jgi:hypothetical protein